MMLPSDLVLLEDPEFKQLVGQFPYLFIYLPVFAFLIPVPVFRYLCGGPEKVFRRFFNCVSETGRAWN
jgi:hypothetical protein